MYIFLRTDSEDPPDATELANIGRFSTKGQSPFLIPSAIIKHHLEGRVETLNKKKEKIFQLECKMGVRFDYFTRINPLSIDFEDTTRQINAVNARLAWTTHSCRRTERLLDFMDRIAVRYAEQAAVNGVSEDEIANVQRAMRNSHSFLRSWNEGVDDQVEYLTKRLHALSQSVSSFIDPSLAAGN